MTLETFFEQFELLADAPNGVKKLRELILQLAVQGKLVPQYSDEEPASVLLDKIKSKQEQMVQDGKIKRASLLPISLDENPFKLPPAWEWVRLGSITEVITKGSSPKWQGINYVDSEQGILFITSENVRNYSLDLAEPKFVEPKFNEIEPRSILKRNDILMNIVGASIGRTAIYDQDAIANINQAVCLIRVIDSEPKLNLSYLLHFFNSQTCIDFMFAKQVDNARANLSMGNIAKFPIPLPPPEEQKRIVSKVHDLMALCDRLEEQQKKRRESCIRLNEGAIAQLLSASNAEESDRQWQRIYNNFDLFYSLPENIEKLRQAILQLAVQGDLVLQNPNDEPASFFLARVQAEKERLFKEGVIRREVVLPEINYNEADFSLKEGWRWERLGNLFRFIDYRGKTPIKTERGVRLITAKNVRMGVLNKEPEEFISEETYEKWMTRGFPRSGDLLFTTEAPLGNVAQLLTTEKVALAQRIIDLQPFADLSTSYMMFVLISPWMQNVLRREATGMTAQGIKASRLKLIPVPMPPLEEQKRIVAKVDRLMKLCDELEAKLKGSYSHQEELMEVAAVQLMQVTSKAPALC